MGFARVAVKHGCTIIPVINVGTEDMVEVRGERQRREREAKREGEGDLEVGEEGEEREVKVVNDLAEKKGREKVEKCVFLLF